VGSQDAVADEKKVALPLVDLSGLLRAKPGVCQPLKVVGGLSGPLLVSELGAVGNAIDD
jgi:hypothetical protein